MSEILDNFTFLENVNWKGTFKDGYLFVLKFHPNLNGYTVCGLNNNRKPRLTRLFLLKDDIDSRCHVVSECPLLQSYVDKIKNS